MKDKEKEELRKRIWEKYFGTEAQRKLKNYLNHLIKDEGITEEELETIQNQYYIEYNEELVKNGLEQEMFFGELKDFGDDFLEE